MHRIDTPTAQKDKFGQGKNGFTNGDPTTGTPSTKLNSDICDALQEEVCTVIERAGIRLNKSQHDQLYLAVKKLSEAEANKAKNALIDSSTVDLNTLNKLAKALGNDPKFSETVTNVLNQKLAKNQNGADIPDKNLFLKNLGLLETVDCAKNALDKRTGGTVNGDIISQGSQISLKGNGRQHFMFQDKDGSRRMWLYKDQGGDGVRLNNGNDGGGDYVFHKDGGFRAPSSVYAGAARMAADGNVVGSKWGNQWLDVYLKNTFQPKGTYGQPNTAKREVNGWWKCGDTGLIIQWAIYGKGKVGTYDFPLPIRFPNAGLFCIGYAGAAIPYNEDRASNSAHLVDNATIRVTVDGGPETVVLAIGF